MNTQHLRYAVEVERCGSITKAAENLYMNQPHLSKTIHELEETLGIVIFKRTSKGMFPTKKGREFLSYAKNILDQMERMERMLADEDEGRAAFAIAVPRASYIAAAFANFAAALPPDVRMELSYRETNSMRTIREVSDAEFDLGVIRFQTEYESYFNDVLQEKNLRAQLVLEFPYYLLMSEKHPLAANAQIENADLEPYTEITHGDSDIPSNPIASFHFLPGGPEKRRVIAVYERASQLELLDRVPDTYMWVSPMPQYILDKFSLVQRQCANLPGNRHKDCLICRKDYRFSKEDELFIKKLEETTGTLSQID